MSHLQRRMSWLPALLWLALIAPQANGQPMMQQGQAGSGYPMYDPAAYGPPVYASPGTGGYSTSDPGTPMLDYYVGSKTPQWDESGPIEGFLTQLVTRSTLRMEYLLWTTQSPGNTLVGSRIADVRNPRSPFDLDPPDDNPFDDPIVPVPVFGESIIPNLGQLSLNDNPGIRGTLSLPFGSGDLELSVWGLQRQSDLAFTNIRSVDRTQPDPNDATMTLPESVGAPGDPNFVIPLTIDGRAVTREVLSGNANNPIIFDDSFQANMSSRMWGSEVNFVRDYIVPGEGLQWRPLVGARFMNLDETFAIRGVFNNGGENPTPRITTIRSESTNNMWGPELGFRSAFVHRWFTLSATPRLSLGVNQYKAQVASGPLFDTTEPVLTTSEDDFAFTPVAQVSLAVDLNLSERVSLHIGYDMMWAGNVSRPFNNIRYDSITNPVDGSISPNIVLDDNRGTFWSHGLSVGGVIHFP